MHKYWDETANRIAFNDVAILRQTPLRLLASLY